jgi:hypothetical protein
VIGGKCNIKNMPCAWRVPRVRTGPRFCLSGWALADTQLPRARIANGTRAIKRFSTETNGFVTSSSSSHSAKSIAQRSHQLLHRLEVDGLDQMRVETGLAGEPPIAVLAPARLGQGRHARKCPLIPPRLSMTTGAKLVALPLAKLMVAWPSWNGLRMRPGVWIKKARRKNRERA